MADNQVKVSFSADSGNVNDVLQKISQQLAMVNANSARTANALTLLGNNFNEASKNALTLNAALLDQQIQIKHNTDSLETYLVFWPILTKYVDLAASAIEGLGKAAFYTVDYAAIGFTELAKAAAHSAEAIHNSAFETVDFNRQIESSLNKQASFFGEMGRNFAIELISAFIPIFSEGLVAANIFRFAAAGLTLDAVTVGATLGGVFVASFGEVASKFIAKELLTGMAAKILGALAVPIGAIGGLIAGQVVGYAVKGFELLGDAITYDYTLIAKLGEKIKETAFFIAQYYSNFAKLSLNDIASNGNISDFLASVAHSGDSAKTVLDNLLFSLKQFPGATDSFAAGMETALTKLPNYTVPFNKSMIELLKNISSNADEAKTNLQTIFSAFSDQKNGGSTLANITMKNVQPNGNSAGDMSGQLIDANKLLETVSILKQRMSDTQGTQYIDALVRKLKDAILLNKDMIKEQEDASKNTNFFLSAIRSTYEINIDKTKDYVKELENVLVPLENQQKLYEKLGEKMQEQLAFQKALNAENSTNTQLTNAQNNINLLQQNQKRATSSNKADVGDDEHLLILTGLAEAGNQGKAGMQAFLNVANNRALSNYNGFGSDITSQLTAPKQFSALNNGGNNPAFQQAKQLSTDSAAYKQMAELVAQLKNGTLKDITNGATDYYRKGQTDNPNHGNNFSNVQQIGDHTFGNSPGHPQVVNGDVNAEITESLQKQNEIAGQLRDKLNGGTETQLTALAVSKQQLANGSDELAQAEAMLAAAKNKVAAAQSYGKEAQTGAQNELVAAQKSVEEKTKALAIAQAEYELSQKPDSFKGTQEELEAKKQIIDIQRTGIVENSALDLQLQKQKQALQDAYDKQQIQNEKARGNLDLASMQPGNKATFQKQKDVASIGINDDSSEQDKIASATRLAEIQKQETDQKLANDKLAENTSYQLAMQTFQQKQQLFKSELAAKTLTRAQELVGEQELSKQEEALTTAHYKKLADLVKGNEQETIQIENQRILAIAALKNKEVEQNQAAQAKIQQQYMQTSEQAAQVFGNAITGIITKQETLAQAGKQLLTKLLGQYITFGAQQILLNTGIVGKDVATLITGENLKTAAVVQGNAARTAANTAGAGAGAATTLEGVIKSITASAGEAFAGVFGFLSPILGPAAAGPAAAAQATVMGHLPSFDVGAWNLPRDMVAQVHQGETILPAGAASAFRQMASGQTSQTGGDVHVHHSTNFNVQAMDGASVKKFFNNNGAHIMGSINNSVKLGTNLGFSKLKG